MMTPAYKIIETTNKKLRGQKRRHDTPIQNLKRNVGTISIERVEQILAELAKIKPTQPEDALIIYSYLFSFR